MKTLERTRGLWRILYKTEKVRKGLCWGAKDVRYSRTMRYLSKKAAQREWNQLVEEMYISFSNTGEAELLTPFHKVDQSLWENRNHSHGAIRFGACSAGF